MYLKKTPNSHGRIRLSIVDTYYDKAKKCSRQKTVESIGWLDELEKQYDDPIAHFTTVLQQHMFVYSLKVFCMAAYKLFYFEISSYFTSVL